MYSVSKDRYYIGQTEDLNKRLTEHIIRKNLGASDWQIVYNEMYETRSEAVKRESEIKSKKRRSYIELLIQTKT
jgi:putative endonuclease